MGFDARALPKHLDGLRSSALLLAFHCIPVYEVGIVLDAPHGNCELLLGLLRLRWWRRQIFQHFVDADLCLPLGLQAKTPKKELEDDLRRLEKEQQTPKPTSH